MLRATTLLTNDQIKHLPSLSIEVVAAPGVGKYLFPFMAVVETDFSFGDYTNISDESLVLGASDIVITLGENAANMFRAIPMAALGPTQSKRVASVVAPVQPTYPRSAATDDTWGNSFGFLSNGFDRVENLHWTISADNAGGDFTGGHASNWMLVKVFYAIETWHVS